MVHAGLSEKEGSGQPPGNIISVTCHLGEVCHPSVPLGKSFQASVTI